jgi:hypothetical protein
MTTSSLAGSHSSTRPLLLVLATALALLAALGVHAVAERSGSSPASAPAATVGFVSDGRGAAAAQYVSTLIAMHEQALATASR